MQQVIKGSLILILVCSILGASFWFGQFSQWFNSNQCYSNILSKIKAEFDPGNNLEQDKALESLLKKIEIRGYETDCEEITKSIGL